MAGEYGKARRLAEKEYRRLVGHGIYPFVPALEKMIPEVYKRNRTPVGVMKIPIDMIGGTLTEMRRRIRRLRFAMRRGVDLLVTHAPAKGYGDLEDLAHQGFDCFNRLLLEQNLKFLAHGHVHKDYGNFQRITAHPSGALLINCWKSCVLDTDTGLVCETYETIE